MSVKHGCCEFGLPTRIFDSHMARELNVLANSIGLVVLEAATPESLEAVVDRWLDTHMTTEVVAMDMQTTPPRSRGQWSIPLLCGCREQALPGFEKPGESSGTGPSGRDCVEELGQFNRSRSSRCASHCSLRGNAIGSSLGMLNESLEQLGNSWRGIERRDGNDAGSSQQACGVSGWVGQSEYGATRTEVLVEFGGNLRVAVGRLHDQERVGTHHLLERLAVRDGRKKLD